MGTIFINYYVYKHFVWRPGRRAEHVCTSRGKYVEEEMTAWSWRKWDKRPSQMTGGRGSSSAQCPKGLVSTHLFPSARPAWGCLQAPPCLHSLAESISLPCRWSQLRAPVGSRGEVLRAAGTVIAICLITLLEHVIQWIRTSNYFHHLVDPTHRRRNLEQVIFSKEMEMSRGEIPDSTACVK